MKIVTTNITKKLTIMITNRFLKSIMNNGITNYFSEKRTVTINELLL